MPNPGVPEKLGALPPGVPPVPRMSKRKLRREVARLEDESRRLQGALARALNERDGAPLVAALRAENERLRDERDALAQTVRGLIVEQSQLEFFRRDVLLQCGDTADRALGGPPAEPHRKAGAA